MVYGLFSFKSLASAEIQCQCILAVYIYGNVGPYAIFERVYLENELVDFNLVFSSEMVVKMSFKPVSLFSILTSQRGSRGQNSENANFDLDFDL